MILFNRGDQPSHDPIPRRGFPRRGCLTLPEEDGLSF